MPAPLFSTLSHSIRNRNGPRTSRSDHAWAATTSVPRSEASSNAADTAHTVLRTVDADDHRTRDHRAADRTESLPAEPVVPGPGPDHDHRRRLRSVHQFERRRIGAQVGLDVELILGHRAARVFGGIEEHVASLGSLLLEESGGHADRDTERVADRHDGDQRQREPAPFRLASCPDHGLQGRSRSVHSGDDGVVCCYHDHLGACPSCGHGRFGPCFSGILRFRDPASTRSDRSVAQESTVPTCPQEVTEDPHVPCTPLLTLETASGAITHCRKAPPCPS